MIRINPKGKYRVSESLEFQLGSVTNRWAIASQSDESGKSLKDLAKIRIANRELPDSETFDEFMRMRTSCWILEERNGDFFCDCPVGIKVFSILVYLAFINLSLGQTWKAHCTKRKVKTSYKGSIWSTYMPIPSICY